VLAAEGDLLDVLHPREGMRVFVPPPCRQFSPAPSLLGAEPPPFFTPVQGLSMQESWRAIPPEEMVQWWKYGVVTRDPSLKGAPDSNGCHTHGDGAVLPGR
jgi:hypothetical protein